MKLSFLAATILVTMVLAAGMDTGQAESVARSRISIDGYSNIRFIAGNISLSREDGGTPLAFVFQLDPRGYVIVSGDNRIAPVIAYSYSNACCPEGEAAGPLLDLVRIDLAYRMDHLEEVPAWYVGENIRRWAEMTGAAAPDAPMPEQWPPAGSTPTEGWLEENWTQSAPYNMYCPLDLVTGQRSVAGCPAVAMGAILNFHEETNTTRFDDGDDYYHNYHEYYWIDDDHEAHDFPSWPELNILLDTLEAHYAEGSVTVEDRAAIVYASGAACRQVYTSSVSGTFGVGQAYDAYVRFGFEDCQLLDDAADSLLEKLAQNMMDGMPAHLAIIDAVPQYGHNVVLDGYNTDEFFHINFGWGGASNGWYSFPLSGMPYGMNFIEGVIIDIGEPLMSAEHSVAGYREDISIISVSNPVTNELYTTVSSPEDCMAQLRVYSIGGRLVMSTDVTLGRGISTLSLPLDRMPSGVYVIRIGDTFDEDSAVFTVLR
ncbi:MAG: C10 family peptidase [Candidatus Fermentibacteraceae bacterium]|nr:C10 family peptidase [Candidatus Fermentibacteraceae bacterium]